MQQQDGGWEPWVPHSKDPNRLPDPSTLRRWAVHGVVSLWSWIHGRFWQALSWKFFSVPTILAGDVLPLLYYLPAPDWPPPRRIRGGRLMGLCPLPADHKASFLLDPRQNLFYCYGGGRGGDLIRFAARYHQLRFPPAVARLRDWGGVAPLLQQVSNFHRMQLPRHSEAVLYLRQRGLRSPEVIEHMRIGYAPGRCLRAWLMQLGYSLYGRGIGNLAPHRFLPGGQGGLYGWQELRDCPRIILVEGRFDFALLWQAGFHQLTCWLGSQLNACQFHQLCGHRGTVYLALDSDANQSGQRAAQQICRRLGTRGVTALRVPLPDGPDPNSFFVPGGDARQFERRLAAARP